MSKSQRQTPRKPATKFAHLQKKMQKQKVHIKQPPEEVTRAAPLGDTAMQEDATYICDACGEEIVVPLDLSQGSSQEYVEDCPVCCRPNVIHVEIEEDGRARVWAERE